MRADKGDVSAVALSALVLIHGVVLINDLSN